MLKNFSILFFTLLTYAGNAQYFQYSQYNFTSQRINPAMVASSNYATLGLIYRNQNAGGNINLKSSALSGAYPILSRRTGQRWSGIGVSLLDDRSGGIFTTQEVSASYAVNIFLSKLQTLSLGMKGLYQQRKVNLDGLYTGSQYIPDRGFDGSIFNGENIQFLKSNFLTFSTGLYWQQNNRDGERTAYWGVSLFDFNKPQDSFAGKQSELNSTLTFNGGVRIYEDKALSLTPEVLLTRSASNTVLNIGAITSYALKPVPNQQTPRLDIITKYVVGRSGIIGFQLHRENFSIGFSYDFPVVKANVGNLNAFEIGIELRKLVDVRLRKKAVAKKKSTTAPSAVAKKTIPPKPVQKNVSTASDTSVHPKPVANLKTTLQHKQDSALASAEAGNLQHQALIIEKITLHFNFEFNSSELDDASMEYLDDLSTVLNENEHLKINLTGHTDNVGSAKFNQRLSIYRASTIKDYLTGKGISPDRIQTEGKGLTEPLNQNKTEEERAMNRRVSLVILYED